MSGTLVLAGSSIPVGYTVPPFPSLHFPINGEAYNYSVLYRLYDVWKFTTLWTLIFSAACHAVVLIVALVISYFKKRRPPDVYTGFGGKRIQEGDRGMGGNHTYRSRAVFMFAYMVIAGLSAFVSGSITGLLTGAIYHSGMLAMTTWIPFVWGALQQVFMIITSYSMISIVL